jgi:PhzF family phenazine biosynthesis protein
MKLPIFQVDAFAEKLFTGNPAAVVILKEWLDVQLMQHIAQENNLAETAFVVPCDEHYEIRWFTPLVEVDLCGHATLASAFVLFNFYAIKTDTIVFKSVASGNLSVRSVDSLYELNFPLDILQLSNDPLGVDLFLGIGAEPKAYYKGKTDCLLVFETQEQIENLEPDFTYLSKVKERGVIVTAPGDDVDFVSRFFAPQVGISEDPVTGSAHTTLLPYWSERTGKTQFVAKQLSKRGGTLHCSIEEGRAKIAGKAKLYLKGEIEV